MNEGIFDVISDLLLQSQDKKLMLTGYDAPSFVFTFLLTFLLINY